MKLKQRPSQASAAANSSSSPPRGALAGQEVRLPIGATRVEGGLVKLRSSDEFNTFLRIPHAMRNGFGTLVVLAVDVAVPGHPFHRLATSRKSRIASFVPDVGQRPVRP